jgi:hypothetical protein
MPRSPQSRKSFIQAVDLLKRPGIRVVVAARALAREPDSPVTRTLKLWGDDENPFKRLIVGRSKEARIWRETMGVLLQNLKPDTSGRTVWRGWNFASANARQRLLRSFETAGIFTNARVGMSASYSRRIACRSAFLNASGILWEIRRPHSARDLGPIFRAIGAKYPEQREAIFPRGATFVLTREPVLKVIRQDGHALEVWHYILTEK